MSAPQERAAFLVHGPGYEVQLETLAIAGGGDLEIRSLLDRQQYWDPDGAAARAGISSASWSLFGQIWPSARLLANLMQSWNPAGRRILETGCGLGLASLVLHRRNCDITASDCHPLAETFLHDNQRRNALPFMKYLAASWSEVNPALGRFDLIIGSDILYERNHPRQLAKFMNCHARPSAEVIVIDPGRTHRRAFTDAMAQHGFDCAPSRIEYQRIDAAPFRGHLLHYRR